MTKIKLSGLINESSFALAERLGIDHLGLDLRPKSFQFIQEYKLIELIKENFRTECFYYLHFYEEKDFVIKQFLEDLDRELKETSGYLGLASHFRLEFSDRERSSFYDSFGVPYIWHLRDDVLLVDHLNAKNLDGVVLAFETLEKLQLTGELDSFYQDFLVELSRVKKERTIKCYLDCDWDSNLFPSLLRVMTIDFMALTLNSKVEISYRTLDEEKLESSLSYIKKFIEDNRDENTSKQ